MLVQTIAVGTNIFVLKLVLEIKEDVSKISVSTCYLNLFKFPSYMYTDNAPGHRNCLLAGMT